MRSSTFKIAWRNLGRNRRRTGLAVSAIALGQLIVVFVNCMMAGAFEDMLNIITGPLVGHVQVHNKDWREERAVDLYINGASRVVQEIASLPGVTTVSPRVYSGVLAAPGKKSEEPADAEAGMIIGVDVRIEAREGGVLEGLPPEKIPADNGIVLGKVLARRLGVSEGGTIAVIGQDAFEAPATGLLRVLAVVSSTVDLVNRSGIVMSLPVAQQFLAVPDKAHEVIIHGTSAELVPALADSISKIEALHDASVLPWREAVPELAGMVDMKGVMDLIFVGILFVAAAAGIANTMMMSTFERIREFGMLLAVGCRPSRLVKMVMIESVCLGVIGVLIGSLIGTALVLITSYTGIDYSALTETNAQDVGVWGINVSYILYPRFEFRHIVYGFVGVTLTSVLAATWPSLLAARLEATEALHS